MESMASPRPSFKLGQREEFFLFSIGFADAE